MRIDDVLLPGLPVDLIAAIYGSAPGNEIASGKFFSPESSSCLVANAFAPYFDNCKNNRENNSETLPPLPGLDAHGWRPLAVKPEAIVRFPWRGGRHPCLDLLVETEDALIGVESKRYEPFRCRKFSPPSDAYWRDVWGRRMGRYRSVLQDVKHGRSPFRRLDAPQLVKHAFALRTAAHRQSPRSRQPVLYYLHAEPRRWPDGRVVADRELMEHRAEIGQFAAAVAGDEVAFHACSYGDLLAHWRRAGDAKAMAHAAALLDRFDLTRDDTDQSSSSLRASSGSMMGMPSRMG